jgi:hypothetical protein
MAKAGAPKKAPTQLIRMKVSSRLYAYLTYLKSETSLGASENDVALYLLTQRIEEMQQSQYREPPLSV